MGDYWFHLSTGQLFKKIAWRRNVLVLCVLSTNKSILALGWYVWLSESLSEAVTFM